MLAVRYSGAAGTPEFRIFTTATDSVVTISGLAISNGRASSGERGSCALNRGTLTIRNSTFFANTSDVGFLEDGGGGIYNESPDSTDFYLRGTIVAKKQAPEGPDASGAFRSGGYNLIGDTTGASGFGSTELTNTRSGLDPMGLRVNDDPTKTIALVSSSPATDSVPRMVCPQPISGHKPPSGR